jgi:hypothetical protein
MRQNSSILYMCHNLYAHFHVSNQIISMMAIIMKVSKCISAGHLTLHRISARSKELLILNNLLITG